MDERIIILQRILPHYRSGFFTKFCLRFPGSKILFGQPVKGESLKNFVEFDPDNFFYSRNFYLGKSGKIFFSDIYSRIFRLRPKIIISVFNVGNLNLYLLYILKFFLKYKLVLWSFGYDPSAGFYPYQKYTDRMRLFLSQKADAVIFYWENGRKEILKYSKKVNHFFIAPNTLDTEKLLKHKIDFDKIGKENIKQMLGVNEKFHFVYIGRLIKDKQVDLLLKAFGIVKKAEQSCSLSIIGDGPEYDYLKDLSRKLDLENVNFMGEIFDEEITGKWIYISDGFVIPGRLGLSVVHSFCYGTPIISQLKEGFYHGEGIGYVKNGVNSLLSEDGSVDELAKKLICIIRDNHLSSCLRLNALETAKKECSIENMMYGFEKTFQYLRNEPENNLPA